MVRVVCDISIFLLRGLYVSYVYNSVRSVLPWGSLFHKPGTWRVAGSCSTGTVNVCVLCIGLGWALASF